MEERREGKVQGNIATTPSGLVWEVISHRCGLQLDMILNI
jgi:hypothetical protein